MRREEILAQIKSRLSEAYGDRLRGVVLYGSEARGTARPDSDIDVLVLLTDVENSWREIRIACDALYPLMLEIGRTIDARPVDVQTFQTGNCPLYRVAHEEGVAV